MLRKALPFLLALTWMLSCDQLFYAQLKEDSSPEQPVFQTGSNPDFSGQALVHRVSVFGRPRTPTSPDTARSWRTFWELALDSGVRHVGLREVTYGLAPVGLHPVVGPESLRAGYVYSCHFACSGLSPTVYFEIALDRKTIRVIRPLHAEQWQHVTGLRDSDAVDRN